MLRPAKQFFASLNHLRLLLKTKVSEFTRPPPPPEAPPAVVFHLAANAIAKHALQHQQNVIQAQMSFNQQVRLLRVIQERFPIVNVFAHPVLRPVPAFNPAAFLSRGTRQPFQVRTIISTPSASAVGGQFPRTAFVGYGSPGFARNFSSAKATTLFNANAGASTATACGPSNIFAQYSTRTFGAAAPKANLATQNSAGPNQAMSLKVGRVDDDETDGNNLKCEASCRSSSAGCTSNSKKATEYGNLFHVDSKGIFEVVSSENGDIHAHKPRVVRRVTAIRRAHNIAAGKKPLRTDPAVADPQVRRGSFVIGMQRENETVPASSDPHGVARKPPDHVSKSNTKRKKRIYMSILLDQAPMYEVETLMSRVSIRSGSMAQSVVQRLDTSLVRDMEDVAKIYQTHFRTITRVLEILMQHGEFNVVVMGNELQVVFPPSICNEEQCGKEEVAQWLKGVGIDSESPHFTIEETETEDGEGGSETERESKVASSPGLTLRSNDSDDSEDDLVVVSSLSSSIVSVSAFSASFVVEPALLISRPSEIGPEYFRGIQEFLDNVDNLIETSPTFGQRG